MVEAQRSEARRLSSAALQAAHFERWRRRYAPTQIAPRGFDELLPESPRAITSLLGEACACDGADQQALAERSLRSVAATLARAQSESLKALLRQRKLSEDVPDVYGRPTQGIPDVLNKLPRDWSHALEGAQGAEPVCRCAEIYTRCQGVEHRHVRCHHSNLSFDSETFISKAIEHVVLQARRDQARELIESGRPPNWANDGGGDLFDRTFVADAEGNELKGVKLDALPRNFYLREQTSWNTNRNFEALSDIVLSISDYTEVLAEGDVLKMSFSYRLRQCLETQFFVARSPGGINVDDGESYVHWEADTPGSDQGLLHIYASKRLRFSRTREIGGDEAMLLNTMAPAILSMLLQRLAFDRPLEVVSRGVHPPLPSRPAVGASPSRPSGSSPVSPLSLALPGGGPKVVGSVEEHTKR